jgi:2,4-dienoyl-CoA reductase-like NADH-dependent reductase (Old Yellow Enzyme family)
MAKLSNIAIRERAMAGQRIFSVAHADAAAFKMQLWRAGFKVSKRSNGKVATIKIEDK